MNNSMRSYFISICCFVLLLMPNISQAIPKIRTEFGRSADDKVRIKIHNETRRELACYIAINGTKTKFRLVRFSQSKWYKATDTRTNYKQFSTWCDYIEHHPEYKKYQ